MTRNSLGYGLVLLALFSCATPARQTDHFLSSPRDIPEYVQIENIPFIDQTENYCGPTTLSMVMSWAGKPTDIEEIAQEIYSHEEQGTLQGALIRGATRQGMAAVPIYGLSNLLHEIAAGHPVIIFENLGLSWYPRWHYALVIGYDLKEGNIILHSGHDAFKHWDLRKFERSWILGEYWGLTVLPPNQLSATADELAQVDAGAALEEIGHIAEAKTLYEMALKKWPNSLTALIGLGNTAFSEEDFQASVNFFRMAVKNHPGSWTARANLRTAERSLLKTANLPTRSAF